MRAARGFSAIEILVSISVGCLVLLGLAAVLRFGLHILTKIRETRETRILRSTAYDLLSKIADDMDAMPIAIAPRIHPAGVIRFTDGTDSPLEHGGYPPAADSCSVSFAAADLQATMAIIRASSAREYTVLTACPRYTRGYRRSEHAGLLGIFPYDATELEVIDSSTLANGCEAFAVREARSMITAAHPRSANDLLFVVPIKEIYTFYLDRYGVLRRAGHRAGEDIELQPIREHVRSFCASATPLQVGGFVELRATVSPQSGPPFSVAVVNRLAHRPLYNFYLQQHAQH